MKLQEDLLNKWNINSDIGTEKDDETKDIRVTTIDDMTVSLAIIPSKVPDNEAEENARFNYSWKEAVEVTSTHVAHIVVSVLNGDTKSPFEAGELYVKIIDAMCSQKSVIGIYTSGTVFSPKFYRDAAAILKNGNMPLLNWIFFGLTSSKKGRGVYTIGMESLGFDEIEVLDSDKEYSDLRDFIVNISAYILEEKIILKDGETIGFSENEILPIKRSQGINIDGITLKIKY